VKPNDEKTKIIKILRGLRWLPINQYTHNNQPKTGGRDGGDYGGEARRVGGARKCNIIIFGGAKVKVDDKKLK
jgi:hypothetical protein